MSIYHLKKEYSVNLDNNIKFKTNLKNNSNKNLNIEIKSEEKIDGLIKNSSKSYIENNKELPNMIDSNK